MCRHKTAYNPSLALLLSLCRYYVPNPAAAGQKKKKKGGPVDDVPKELELLKGITGYAEPGVLMALMGGSGAGKTTLMDVIAGRKTVGRITGEIFVNGKPKDQNSWSRMMGYVEQVGGLGHSRFNSIIKCNRSALPAVFIFSCCKQISMLPPPLQECDAR